MLGPEQGDGSCALLCSRHCFRRQRSSPVHSLQALLRLPAMLLRHRLNRLSAHLPIGMGGVMVAMATAATVAMDTEATAATATAVMVATAATGSWNMALRIF